MDAIHIVDHVNHVDKLRVMILFYDTDPFYFFERKLKYSQSFALEHVSKQHTASKGVLLLNESTF